MQLFVYNQNADTDTDKDDNQKADSDLDKDDNQKADTDLDKDDNQKADTDLDKGDNQKADTDLYKGDNQKADTDLDKGDNQKADTDLDKDEDQNADIHLDKDNNQNADIHLNKDDNQNADIHLDKDDNQNADMTIPSPCCSSQDSSALASLSACWRWPLADRCLTRLPTARHALPWVRPSVRVPRCSPSSPKQTFSTAATKLCKCAARWHGLVRLYCVIPAPPLHSLPPAHLPEHIFNNNNNG